ncbi:Malate dehydrogenase (oxaloacetate-decarboxylating) (NADP(+)) [Magnetococcus marinus MC-1]|uniref:Malate dehydrogenase (Oxaloacetate-decarboxylating) (NADP(+)) n=1 Tax=Magnetococcus marinus (strain ATCC BAA-1437 / JCM 17883 / MC-1) TaxID=156889 RepID=A0L5P5_MAGMM|nr:NAD-dependent malic enzyme [Magnetococcus marinus]ABK43288.1 Malate dehydrogenase (oxaloacetate-decarboxylating) (NADP(+)) [Magnetococcus marinus MC-1]
MGKTFDSNRLKELTGHANPLEILNDPYMNKGVAFTEEERDLFHLRGLLPPRVQTMEAQLGRALDNFRCKPNDLEKYIFLTGLQERNETLFYRLVMTNIEEMLPIIYTPTVGKACQTYGHIFRRPQGMFISINDKGRIAELLGNWVHKDVRVIVVTDGSRILGLGDLGAHGMGIPVGKLALYTALAGIPPIHCLPVTLDMGTNNEALRNDPLYVGLPQPRVTGEIYDEMIEEFVLAVQEQFPRAMIQFEDFSNDNAFRLLEKYQDRICTFNDDIQGTAAVALAGILGALRITEADLCTQRYLFMGAGSAGFGIADLILRAMEQKGIPREQGLKQFRFMDSRGLVTRSRTDLRGRKSEFVCDDPPLTDLQQVVERFMPTVLIGVSGQPGVFHQGVVEAMARINPRPIIFALSNPTSKAECSAQQCYQWSDGRAIFASGSPFEPVTIAGQTFVSGQGNNAYCFPGIGLGVIMCEASRVTEEMFLVAAQTLAQMTAQSDLDQGRVYPSMQDIRAISLNIALAVVDLASKRGLAQRDLGEHAKERISAWMCNANYRNYANR